MGYAPDRLEANSVKDQMGQPNFVVAAQGLFSCLFVEVEPTAGANIIALDG